MFHILRDADCNFSELLLSPFWILFSLFLLPSLTFSPLDLQLPLSFFAILRIRISHRVCIRSVVNRAPFSELYQLGICDGYAAAGFRWQRALLFL